MRILTLATVLLSLSSASVLGAESDDAAFKERVAACQTEGCLVNVAHLYLTVWNVTKALESYSPTGIEKKRYDAELARLRGQLHDPEIFSMLDDGRWDAMSEQERQEWTEKRWGPDPDDIQ